MTRSFLEKIQSKKLVLLALAGILLFLLGVYWLNQRQSEPPKASPDVASRAGQNRLHLTSDQVHELEVKPVITQSFIPTKEAIGIVDFNQDQVVQVFSPYQGRIGRFMVKAGEDVQASQLLYTVQIPDLAQAGSTLIAAMGTLKVTNETLARAKLLFESQSIALKELQQNMADQAAAEAAYKAARKTMALFGLSDAAIDEVEKTRKIETEMPVLSPFAGRVIARAGAVGQLVQPGNAPAPLTVANIQNLWLVANVPESELPYYQKGQLLKVKVQAFANTSFDAKVNYVGDAVDPNTHRIVVRADLKDAKHVLRPQMLANFSITVGDSAQSPALPLNALVRESDGSMSAWVAQEQGNFERRSVTVGLTQNNMVQILSGLKAGEKVAHNKALFLSNLYLTSIN